MRFIPLRIVAKDMTISHHADCLIVGAGIAGLVAARTLQNRGVRALVLDKGRGVGGRLATETSREGASTTAPSSSPRAIQHFAV